MRRPNHLAEVLAATVLLGLASACSSDSDTQVETLDESNIRDRVAEALRDAETFHFEMTMPRPDAGQASEEVVTSGDVEYADDGEVEALGYVQDGAVEYRFVDGRLHHRADPDDGFRELGAGEAEAIVQAWDWAAAVEKGPEVEELDASGQKTIDGVETTEYEVTTADGTETWWVDASDRLVRQSAPEIAVESRLNAYGEPVDITAPQ